MVKKVFYKTRSDGVNLYKTESDQKLMLRKVGTNLLFESAIDVEGAPYEYEETDIPVPVREPKVQEGDSE